MGKQDKSLHKRIEQEEQYVDFLRKRLASANFKANVSEEEYAITKKKYDKSKLKLKFLKEEQ
jgi:hypothetical protein